MVKVYLLGAELVERDIIYKKLARMDGWSSTFSKTTFESLQNLKTLFGPTAINQKHF